MTSAFQTQLAAIARTQTNELDLRARRKTHAESLLFQKDVAIKQSWDTIYTICYAGFVDLCALDPRFNQFSQNLFALEAKDQDREQLDKRQNELLDDKLEQCLELLSGRLLLRPGARALEWLVRRFQVQKYNVSALLRSVLCWHEDKIFQNILAIIPEHLIRDEWKFLRPYHSVGQTVPRHTIVYAATNNDNLFTQINVYALSTCRNGTEHPQFMKWWGSLIVASVSGRLNQAKSGRMELQKQKTDDVLTKVLPSLKDGLKIEDCPEMIITCYTLAIVMASSEMLDDGTLDKMMSLVVRTIDYKNIQMRQILITLSVLLQQKQRTIFGATVMTNLLNENRFQEMLQSLAVLRAEFDVLPFIYGLIQSLLTGLKENSADHWIEKLATVLSAALSMITPAAQVQIVRAIATYALGRERNDSPVDQTNRVRIARLMQQLHESELYNEALAVIAEEFANQGVELQDLLQTSIQLPVKPVVQDDETELEDSATEVSNIDWMVKEIAHDLPDVDVFASFSDHPVFKQCLKVLRNCSHIDGGLEKFRELAIWHNSQQASLSYIKFLVCASVENDSRCSAAALQLLSQHVDKASQIDTQDLLPYVTLCLGSLDVKVRRAASSLVLAMLRAVPDDVMEDETSERLEILPATSGGSAFLPSNHLSKILNQTYVPVLEECDGDAGQMKLTLTHVLNGSPARHQQGLRKTDLEMKKMLRQDLFRCLLNHLTRMPNWSIKIELLELLNDIARVGVVSKFELVMPLFRSWTSLSLEEIQQTCRMDELSTSRLDRALSSIISAEEAGSAGHVLEALERQPSQLRESLLEAISKRVEAVWKNLAPETQQSLVTRLFNLSFSTNGALGRHSRAVVRQLQYSTPTIQALIDHAVKVVTDMPQEGPPKKRRRTSRDYESQDQASAALTQIIPKLALALEVVDAAKPELRPELLPVLFDVLVMLSKMKRSQQNESPYLVHLCMCSILAITNKAQNARRPNIDTSAIRADVVTEIVRTAESPQIQATALQLASTLAMLVPEKVIHNLMPVFTFHNSKLLSKDDEHSVNIVDQAIDHIIPPLVISLKRQDPHNVVLAAKGILSSFAAAYDHISQSRRIKLYQRLLNRLGSEGFSYAFVAMLATRRQDDPTLGKFFHEVLGGFSPLVVLVTYRKILALVSDMVAGQTHEADALLSIDKSTSDEEKGAFALNLFATAEYLLRSKQLVSAVNKCLKSNSDAAEQVKDELRACLHQILHSIREHKQTSDKLAFASRTCLSALLELLSPAQLMESVTALFREMTTGGEDLKAQMLRVVAAQLQAKAPTDQTTVEMALALLHDLKPVLQSHEDTDLRLACLACIDRLAESYGRRETDQMVELAKMLSSATVADDEGAIATAAALTLASIVDIAGESAVPVVSTALQNAFLCIERSLEEGHENEELHNATFALISALVSNLAFMISEEELGRILELSAEAAFLDLPATCTEARREVFSAIGRKVELPILTNAISQTWRKVIENDVDAVLPVFDLLSAAIEHHPKSVVTASAELISSLTLEMLDLRRIQLTIPSDESYSIEDITTIESRLSKLILGFIYKLNDAIFRPLFENWIEWATTCTDVTDNLESAQLHRQTSLFSVLDHFFTSLKSIVTSYSIYLLPPANTLLSTIYASPNTHTSQSQLHLYTSLLSTLTTCFTHDADDFFASPSHFKTLCSNLTSHISLAASKPFRPLIFNNLIPCLVALAAAVQDTPAHHLAINHALSQLRHHESSHVRLAGIRTHIAITENEDVGEAWVGHVVTGAAGAIDVTAADDDDRERGTGQQRGRSKAVVVGGSGETMIYVNEMLEDDDETVEAEVRRWVRMVRDMVGEEVFEF